MEHGSSKSPGNSSGPSAAIKQTLERPSETMKVSEGCGRFMKALLSAERERDIDALLTCFSDSAELGSVGHREGFRGRAGARRFWQGYLTTFDRIQTRFTSVTEKDGRAILEWTSDASLRHGKHVQYDGVSILELKDGYVQKFRTYYDTAAFLHPMPGELHA